MWRVGYCASRPVSCCCKDVLFQRYYATDKGFYGYNSNSLRGRPSRSETLYTELGVGINASQTEIKKAYLDLCKQYHPDSNTEDKTLHDKFVRINEAYKILIKPHDRMLYDKALEAGLNPEPGEVNTVEHWNPNVAQFYYHPKFYHDPKMREAAAKAWEADTGWSFVDYYAKDSPDRPKPLTRREKLPGLLIALMGWLFGWYLVYRTYKKSMKSAAENRLMAEGNINYEQQFQNNRGVSVGKIVTNPTQVDNETIQVKDALEFLYHKEK